jgi:predicted nucleotidyltransferase
MNQQEILAEIKKTVLSVLPNAKLFLFGSRARGDARDESDFDILAEVENDLSGKEKHILKSAIREKLFPKKIFGVDVKIHSSTEIKEKSTWAGHYLRDAVKEMVTV